MFGEQMEIALIKTNTSKTELADKLDMSLQNLYKRIKRDNMTEEQMKEMVEALDAKIELKIILKDGTEI